MRRVAAIALVCALACTPALRTPRPIGTSGPPAATGARNAPELLAEARARFARRPDLDEVRQAEALFLAAVGADPKDVAALYGAIQAKIWRIDHDRSVDRGALASSAVDAGQWCLRSAPASAWCDYGLALALGVQARERRATAVDGLKRMVEHLRRAAAEDPGVDDAGPDRVLALVLARAPGWPVGPGDPEAAVEAARRAEQRVPEHPPNPIALAEALLATGAVAEARAAAERGLALARGSVGDPDAPEWVRDGEALLSRTREARPTDGVGFSP